MAHLILVRHGKSEWNKLGLWTGHTDVALTDEGITEAKEAGELISDTPIHHVFVSGLKRAQQTLEGICTVYPIGIEPIISQELNERHYGIYTGKNKWEVKDEIGEEAFQRIRRGWDVPIPEGESLKDVYNRTVPFYQSHIHPHLANRESALVVAHGNTLRALMKYIEDIDDMGIENLEVATGEVHRYEFNDNGIFVSKVIRKKDQAAS